MMLNIVNQLRFARSEFRKGFKGVSEEEGFQRMKPVNSIGWIVGHLAWHEQFYWLTRPQDIVIFPELVEQVGFNKPASTPSLTRMITVWEEVIQASDQFLDKLSKKDLTKNMIVKGRKLSFNIGTMISRVIYHYWYHNGEIQALRQLMKHTSLPDFVSDDIETIGSFYLDENK